MMQVLYLLALSHNYMGDRKNTIHNTCDFDILRIQKKDITCIDYGEYKYYCNHYALPQEFMIYNENGLSEKNIIIKPTALWDNTDNNKKKMANFYYTFICDESYKIPKLIQHIVPTKSYDTNPVYVVIITIILVIVLLLICPNSNNMGGFTFGYITADIINRNRKVSCE